MKGARPAAANTQNRPPPAYQEYAAAMMSKIEYRTLTLTQRGLLFTMRLECWVNRSLPNSPEVLARVLGFETDEIAANLSKIMPFFECADGSITSPELEDYRAYLEGIREKRSEGGKRGAAVTNSVKQSKRRAPSTIPPGISSGISSGMPSGMPSGEPSSTPSSDSRLLSKAKSSQAQPRKGGFEQVVRGQEWGDFDDFTADPEGVDE